jgi:hypothetical protein
MTTSQLPKLNNDICLKISEFLYKPKYKLVHWINPNKLSFYWNILKHLETSIDPTSGYCYERMWQHIFGTEEIHDSFNPSPQ